MESDAPPAGSERRIRRLDEPLGRLARDPHSDEPERALGSNPFRELPAPGAFLVGLRALRAENRPAYAGPGPGAVQKLSTESARALLDGLGPAEQIMPRRARPAPAKAPLPEAERAPAATPLSARRWATTPRLADVETPRAEELIDHLLSVEDRKRMAALAHLIQGESPYDRYGLSIPTLKRTFPIIYLLYRHYFRVQSQGAGNVPTRGPVVVASNHAGLLPFDATMLVLDLLLQTDPPRLARTIVDRWAGELPFVSVFYARVGQIIGTRENFADLLDDGQLVLVFPEGMRGATKLITQRYRLQKFHVGFVEQALRAQAPVVPAAVIGSDDQTPVLFDLASVAGPLGLPSLPITPTFPWLGPMGLLPYPVRYRIVYGEAMNFQERFGPDDADDPRLVQYLARQVRGAVQSLIDRHR